MASFFTVFTVYRDKLGKSVGWGMPQDLFGRLTIRLEDLGQQKLLLVVRLSVLPLLDYMDLGPYLIVGTSLDCKCIFT